MIGNSVLARVRQSELLRNSRVLLTGALLAQAVPVIASPLLTRLYSPEEMGLWGTYTSIVLTLGTFAALRLDVAIMLAKGDASAKALYRTATRSSLVVCGAVTLAFLFLGEQISKVLNAEPLHAWLLLVGLNVFALSQFQTLGYWLNRKSEYRELSRSRAGQSAVATGTQLGLGAAGAGVGGLIGGTLLGYGIGALRLRLLERGRLARGGAAHSSRAVLRENWRMPVLNGIGAMADAIRTNGMNIAIAINFSQASLGAFTIAWRSVFLPISLISASVSQVFFQRFTNTEPGGLTRLALKCVAVCAAVGALPFALLGFFGEQLFSVVFGAEWATSGLLAQYMSGYLYLALISSPLASVFLVARRQALLMGFSVFYMMAALFVMSSFTESLTSAIQIFGLVMSLTMIAFLVLAYVVCRQYDSQAASENVSRR